MRTTSLQERDSVACVVGNEGVPAGGGKGGWIAPRVVVDSIEVGSLVISSTVHIISHDLLVLLHVCSRVADWDRAISSTADILLHISGHGFDVGCAVRVACVVDDFVAGQEGHSIGVISKRIDSGEDGLEVDAVVRFGGVRAVQGVQGRVSVKDEVDSCFRECIHAVIVISSVVDGVDTDSVDSKLGEVWNIAGASS